MPRRISNFNMFGILVTLLISVISVFINITNSIPLPQSLTEEQFRARSLTLDGLENSERQRSGRNIEIRSGYSNIRRQGRKHNGAVVFPRRFTDLSFSSDHRSGARSLGDDLISAAPVFVMSDKVKKETEKLLEQIKLINQKTVLTIDDDSSNTIWKTSEKTTDITEITTDKNAFIHLIPKATKSPPIRFAEPNVVKAIKNHINFLKSKKLKDKPNDIAQNTIYDEEITTKKLSTTKELDQNESDVDLADLPSIGNFFVFPQNWNKHTDFSVLDIKDKAERIEPKIKKDLNQASNLNLESKDKIAHFENDVESKVVIKIEKTADEEVAVEEAAVEEAAVEEAAVEEAAVEETPVEETLVEEAAVEEAAVEEASSEESSLIKEEKVDSDDEGIAEPEHNTINVA